jgi:hypothetical protein
MVLFFACGFILLAAPRRLPKGSAQAATVADMKKAIASGEVEPEACRIIKLIRKLPSTISQD